VNVQGLIGEAPRSSESLGVGYMPGEPLAGSPESFAEQLSSFVAVGFDTLVFWPIAPSPEQVELFAGEVVPLLRASP
jgi:alkanesulfonate monooxygenase SsuD/methylene tetrahydromethanopterin reductase-like flavin-dependent oxidoreductase (luciferase family)